MREIKPEEMKKIQMGILTEVDKFCSENNLTYYLCYGTLIGAVRHNGYIPWDDDIDIAMPLPDFYQFCKTFCSSRYRDHFFKDNKRFYLNFAKVEDTMTTGREDVSSYYEIGVHIDVMPLIGLPSNKKSALNHFRKIVFFRSMLRLKKARTGWTRQYIMKAVILLSKIPLKFFTYNWINTHIYKLADKYPYYESEYVICLGGFNKSKEIMERKAFGDTIRLPFEGKNYCAPEGYDAWLRKTYGDYMKLPPVDQRKPQHTFKGYWK